MDWSMGHALTLSRFYDLDGEIVLLDRLDAMRLCREGNYEAIGPWQASSEFQRSLRGFGMMTDWAIRDFAAHLRLSSFPLSEMRDHELVELIEEGIKRGDLVAVKKVDPATLANRPVDPDVAKLRLIREIESKTGGKLTASGRRYRLIRDIDFEKFPERNYYHVVRQDEAKQILDALAKQPDTSAELAELLVKARDQLARDWNSFRDPDGLILLRRAPVARAPVADTGPALTPSQLRKAMLTWIAVEIVDDEDEPWDGTVDVTSTTGSQSSVEWPADGVYSLEEIEPGQVTVKVPGKAPAVAPATDNEAAAPSPAAAADAPEVEATDDQPAARSAAEPAPDTVVEPLG
jgi:hypothetical protein